MKPWAELDRSADSYGRTGRAGRVKHIRYGSSWYGLCGAALIAVAPAAYALCRKCKAGGRTQSAARP